MGDSTVRIGTASWTDPTMTAPGVFYPADADTPEERLRYYASQFPVVEVDATYYALPTRRMGEIWHERTPPDFRFDIKAHALMTGQPSELRRLPKEIREALPMELLDKKRVYGKDLPAEIVDAVRRVAQGLPVLSPAVTRRLIARVAGSGHDRRARATERLALLNDREREVAVAVGQGRSNAEIGSVLYLSVPTVKTHVSSILTKLDLNNRVQIALLAHDAGLLDDPD